MSKFKKIRSKDRNGQESFPNQEKINNPHKQIRTEDSVLEPQSIEIGPACPTEESIPDQVQNQIIIKSGNTFHVESLLQIGLLL